MEKFFIIYDVNTGYQTSGSGMVNTGESSDGTTVAEWIARMLAKDSDNRVAYFEKDTSFDPSTQKILDDRIVLKEQGEVQKELKAKTANRQLKGKVLELFEMLLAVWEVGVEKELWSATDLTPELRVKATEWKKYLADL